MIESSPSVRVIDSQESMMRALNKLFAGLDNKLGKIDIVISRLVNYATYGIPNLIRAIGESVGEGKDLTPDEQRNYDINLP